MKWPPVRTPAVDLAISLVMLILNGAFAIADGDPLSGFLAGAFFVLACGDFRKWRDSRRETR